MDILLAVIPILVVLLFMLIFGWSSQKAGLLSFFICLAITIIHFGLTWQVFWVSQLKGLLLSLNVLIILWTALLLYNLVYQIGGVQRISHGLESSVKDRGFLKVILAWIFTGMIEGIAGFGLPMAIVSPLLVTLGIPPIIAITATAIGHAWAVSFGNMGIVLQTLSSLVGIDTLTLAPYSSLLLGVTCLLCGLFSAFFLKQLHHWKKIVLLAGIISVVQYLFVMIGLAPLGSFAGAATGMVLSIFFSRNKNTPSDQSRLELFYSTMPYLVVVAFTILVSLHGPINQFLNQVIIKASFPQVKTLTGFVTEAGSGQTFHPFVHPGTIIMAGVIISYPILVEKGICQKKAWKVILKNTVESAGPASLGIIFMVALSSLMDHTGLTIILAQAMSTLLGASFPLVSPMVGMLGAFATGSNNNSNVLFASMQRNIANLLKISPALLVSSQTTGGSIGSMIAPAKMVVGCSTTNMKGRDGEVLRYTLPIGLIICLIIGVLTWVLSLLCG